jgi:protein TonB
MGASIRAGTGRGYRSQPPRWASAAAVLLVHLVLLLLVLTQRPSPLQRAPERFQAVPLSIPADEVQETTVLLQPPAEPSSERAPRRPLPQAPQDAGGNPRLERPAPALPEQAAPTATLRPTGTAPPPGDGAGVGAGAASGSGGSGAGVGSGGTGSGGAVGGGATAEPAIAPARWAGAMRWERLNGYHPREALRRGLAGWATLVCRVRLDRTVHSCTAEAESHPGEGFGAAAMRASREFRIYPRQVDGVEVDNARVRTTVRFTLPAGRRAN